MTTLEELKKFTQQEMTRMIKENLDSGIIFTYIQGLENKITAILYCPNYYDISFKLSNTIKQHFF